MLVGGKQKHKDNKRRPKRDHISDSDSDFVIREIRRKRLNDGIASGSILSLEHATDELVLQHSPKPLSVKKGKNRSMDEYNNLKNRTSPLMLSNTIKGLTDVQKQEVRDMGFGAILHLDINNVPPKLAYWILDNFDTNRCEIVLEDGRRVHVGEEDVRLMFGFPRGQIPIERRIKNTEHVLVADWRLRFRERAFDRIRPIDISADIKKEANGGLWFKRQFLVLLTCCLIESLGNSYVSPQILDFFEDINNVVNLNWCGYVIKCLIDHTMVWKNNKLKHYTGPTLFITLLYVDRVVLGYRTVQRSSPAIIEWKKKMLVKRQNMEIERGGFGKGYPDGPFVLINVAGVDNPPGLLLNEASEHNHEAEHNNEELMPNLQEARNMNGGFDTHGGGVKIHKDAVELVEEANGKEDDVHAIANILAQKGKVIHDTLTEVMTIVKGLSHSMLGNAVLRKMVEATLLVNEAPGSVLVEPTAASQNKLSQYDIDFWDCPEHIAMIAEMEEAEMEEAALKRYELKKVIDSMPSFSLGFTQDWDNVLDVARDIEMSENIAPDEQQVIAEDNAKLMESPQEGQIKDTGVAVFSEKGKEKIVEDNGHLDRKNEKEIAKRVTRGKNLLRKTSSLVSPCFVRPVKPGVKLNSKERDLYFWIMHNEEANIEEIVYSDGRVNFRRKEMETLAADTYINAAVIDVWSTILNHNEKYKAKASPQRFFATTFPCKYTVYDAPISWDKAKRMSYFSSRLLEEVGNVEGLKLDEIDLFFFPICHASHFYLVCFDSIKCISHIIDNSSALEEANIDPKIKYSGIPDLMVEFFTGFMKTNGHSKRSVDMAKKMRPIERMKMPWRNETNKFDCGIYVMRHMETYKGGGLKNWDPELQTNNAKQMKILRALYCVAILSAETNIHKGRIAEDANIHYRMSCEDGLIKIEPIIMNKCNAKLHDGE
ncbi:hypothetical protein C2S53_002504 [Perilla frutescens var. hirtella]|uniref:Ubiquitin-like protease family profile domain-containing protein n=1 Tax=Perilla frutescens var. hirtella TaxID=608512 RepID=A0AAD4J5I1_PERFH|nr:hypothetical protein C2S53_002504 [Perilla frutescens var. hirtella]